MLLLWARVVVVGMLHRWHALSSACVVVVVVIVVVLLLACVVVVGMSRRRHASSSSLLLLCDTGLIVEMRSQVRVHAWFFLFCVAGWPRRMGEDKHTGLNSTFNTVVDFQHSTWS